MAQNLQSDIRADFSGGIDAKSSPWAVSPKAVLRAQNLLFDQRGAMRVRDGYAAFDTLAPATLTTHRAIGDLVKTGVSVEGLTVSLDTGSPTFNKLYRNNPWTFLGNLSQNYEIPQIIQFGTQVIITDAYTTPKSWDSTTFATLTAGAGQTVPGGALFALSHLNQLWVWNTAAARGTLDGPVSLRASDVNNANSWPNGNQVFLGDDSDKGMGLASFSIGETGIAPFPILVAFKGYTAYQVTGTFGASNFAIQQIRTDQGCAASRSIQFCPGLGVVRLTLRGFYLYNGLQDQCISTAIDPYIFGGDGLTGIDLGTTAYLSVAALYPYPPLYVCVCPVSGVLRRWFVLDLLTKSWTVFDLTGPSGASLTALNLIRGDNSQVIVGNAFLRGAFASNKNLYEFSSAYTTDAGTAIAWSVRLPPVPPRSPLRRAYHRRMLAKVYNVTAGQYVTATFAIGPAQSPAFTGGQQVVAQSALVAAQPSVGGALSTTLEEDLNFDIGRTGEVQTVELSGSGPITIRALEWQGLPKPASRPMLT